MACCDEGNAKSHGVGAPWRHQTVCRLAWQETLSTARGRWPRGPHRTPTRHIPSPGAGAMWPRCVARPGNAQSVLPVFSRRSCLCVSCLGFLWSVAGQPVHLTPIEYKLLATLMRHAGKVVTHRQLLHEVWGPHAPHNISALWVHMSQLR